MPVTAGKYPLFDFNSCLHVGISVFIDYRGRVSEIICNISDKKNQEESMEELVFYNNNDNYNKREEYNHTERNFHIFIEFLCCAVRGCRGCCSMMPSDPYGRVWVERIQWI